MNDITKELFYNILLIRYAYERIFFLLQECICMNNYAPSTNFAHAE